MKDKTIVGSIELVGIPAFGLHDIDAKIDTGADSNALHCDNIFIDDNNNVHFQLLDDVHPSYHDKKSNYQFIK